MRNESHQVTYAKAEKTGYGRFKISVSIRNNDFEERIFSHTTTNTEGIDEAMSFEGMERYQALYELIEYSIQDQVQEWTRLKAYEVNQFVPGSYDGATRKLFVVATSDVALFECSGVIDVWERPDIDPDKCPMEIIDGWIEQRTSKEISH